LDYQKELLLEENQTVSIPKPKGLSGGGIWFVDRSSRKLRLAGLQIGTGSEVEVHGIQIKEWLRFLKQSRSGLC
jgi:hypothetical protein